MTTKNRIKKSVLRLFLGMWIALMIPVLVPGFSITHKVDAATLTAPKLVSVKESKTTKAIIKWKKVTGASGYRIYRSNDGKNWKTLKTITNGATVTYTDSKLIVGKRYYYTVRAYKKSGTKTTWGSYDKKGMTLIAGLTTLSLQKKTLSLTKGKSYTLKVSGTSQKIVWKSSDTKIAKVSSTGKVTGVKAGTATISATFLDTKLSCKVTVKEDIPSGSFDFVLNMNTKKFHHTYCPSVNQMNPRNRKDFFGTREQVIAMGYVACKNCKP